MKRIPMKYNSEEKEVIIKLTSRCSKLGDSFFMVEYGEDLYACFKHMSSAMDFIETNFRQ